MGKSTMSSWRSSGRKELTHGRLELHLTGGKQQWWELSIAVEMEKEKGDFTAGVWRSYSRRTEWLEVGPAHRQPASRRQAGPAETAARARWCQRPKQGHARLKDEW
jgi:hypothetical protein